MAFITCTFKSEALKFETEFYAVIPEGLGENIPTVYLLHGISDNHSDWIRKSSCERYAKERGVALIMPDAGRSFYTDMAFGPAYFTYISRELVDYTHRLFRLNNRRENTFICGLSMGGYGAFRIALNLPEQYEAAVSMSGALNAVEFFGMKDTVPDTRLIWGPDTPPDYAKDDLIELVRNAPAGKPKPRLMQFCGTEDYLYAQNQKFRKFIEKTDYDYTYSECPGGHTWNLWDGWLPSALDFFLKR